MSRISVKFGALEIEYEGEQEFIASGLLDFAKALVESTGSSVEAPSSGGAGKAQKPSAPLSTTSIAQKFGAKTGTDLAAAAAAHLVLVKRVDQFSHTELLTEMREAKTFYKKSFHNNLANSLKTLVNAGRFNHLSGNNYALSEGEIADLGAKLD